MRVYSPDFVYIYRVSGFLSAQEVRLYIGTGVLTLVLDTSDDAAYYMRKNGWIVMDDGEPYIIKHIVQGLEQITVTAYGCHKLLEQRITGGGALKTEMISKTGSADAVVKHFIDQCKGDLPLVTAPTHSGSTISDQTRLKGLGDEVSRILTGAGRGERYTFDADNKCIVFDTYQGADRTYGNVDDNPPIVFALKFKNIEDLTYKESAIDEQTTIYVGGAGEGSNREIIVVGNDKTGLDRVERFRDARDVKEGETDKLTERGNQIIIGTQETISTSAISDAGLVYGIDYNLGDVVTTQVTKKTYIKEGDFYNPSEIVKEVNQRITEVAITRDGGAEDIDLRFGDEPITATQTQSMARQIEQLASVEASQNHFSQPNLLINGDFKVWQRGTSFTNPANAYTADRFRCNGAGTVSKDADGMKIVGAVNVKYIMEDKDFTAIDGKAVTLSKSINSVITAETFIADSATVMDLTLTDKTLNWVKLELGSTATPFVPRTYAEELALCQRYYEVGGNSDGAALIGTVILGSSLDVPVTYTVRKRVVQPTITLSSVSGVIGYYRAHYYAFNSTAINFRLGNGGFVVRGTKAPSDNSTWSLYQTFQGSFDWAADAEIY